MRVTVHMAKLYLEAGGGQLVIADPLLGSLDPAHYPQIAGVLRTLWNVADFYDARALVWTTVADADRPSQLLGLGAGGLAIEGDGPLGAVAAQAEAKDQCLAAGLPPELFPRPSTRSPAAVAAWRERVAPPRSLYVCPRVPRTAAPESVQEVLRLLRGRRSARGGCRRSLHARTGHCRPVPRLWRDYGRQGERRVVVGRPTGLGAAASPAVAEGSTRTAAACSWSGSWCRSRSRRRPTRQATSCP